MDISIRLHIIRNSGAKGVEWRFIEPYAT
jgi:hypothetical protein